MNIKKNLYIIVFIIAVAAVLGAFFTAGILAVQYVLESSARQEGAVATLITLVYAIPFVGIVAFLVVRASK